MNLNQLSNEYEQIIQTQFWLMFMDAIRERRKLASRECETREDIRKSQGELLAYDYITGRNEQPPLAERLLLKLRDKSITQEVTK